MHRPSAEGGLYVTPVLDERPQHNPIHYGELAQLGERLVCNQEVTGSSPVFSTKFPSPTGDGSPVSQLKL